MGYFADLGVETDMQPGPSDGTATVKFVDVGQADMGFPSPGVFSFALENGMKLKSAFHMGALDTFSLAFRKGEGTNDLKTLEGKTILLGSAAWQSIVDPMLAVQGVDITKVKYVEAGWPTWGTALAGRPGRCGALAGRACVPSGSAPASTSNTGWACRTRRCFANTFVVRAADLEDPDKKAFLDKYLRGWAMGLEFAYHNPRAAVEAVFEQFPTLASNIGPELGTTSILQQINVVPRRHGQAQGLGRPRHGSLADLLRQDLRAEADHQADQGRGRLHQRLHRAANDFDHAKVKADADAYKLSDAFAADRRRERQGAPLRPGRAGLIDGRNPMRAALEPPASAMTSG